MQVAAETGECFRKTREQHNQELNYDPMVERDLGSHEGCFCCKTFPNGIDVLTTVARVARKLCRTYCSRSSVTTYGAVRSVLGYDEGRRRGAVINEPWSSTANVSIRVFFNRAWEPLRHLDN